MVPGRWSHFKLWEPVARLVGSSINLRDHGEGENDGFKNMPLGAKSRNGATRRREGSSRESNKDYLHFLYISRGSLSEVQYFVHLSRRLEYLAEAEASDLDAQIKSAFGCLHGLIRAVEKETGKLSKAVAVITSLLVIGFARWSSSL